MIAHNIFFFEYSNVHRQTKEPSKLFVCNFQSVFHLLLLHTFLTELANNGGREK